MPGQVVAADDRTIEGVSQSLGGLHAHQQRVRSGGETPWRGRHHPEADVTHLARQPGPAR